MTALLAKPPDLRNWTDSINELSAVLCDPLSEADPTVVHDQFRRLREADPTLPPPDRIARSGDSVVLSWRGGRTAVLGG